MIRINKAGLIVLIMGAFVFSGMSGAWAEEWYDAYAPEDAYDVLGYKAPEERADYYIGEDAYDVLGYKAPEERADYYIGEYAYDVLGDKAPDYGAHYPEDPSAVQMYFGFKEPASPGQLNFGFKPEENSSEQVHSPGQLNFGFKPEENSSEQVHSPGQLNFGFKPEENSSEQVNLGFKESPSTVQSYWATGSNFKETGPVPDSNHDQLVEQIMSSDNPRGVYDLLSPSEQYLLDTANLNNVSPEAYGTIFATVNNAKGIVPRSISADAFAVKKKGVSSSVVNKIKAASTSPSRNVPIEKTSPQGTLFQPKEPQRSIFDFKESR